MHLVREINCRERWRTKQQGSESFRQESTSQTQQNCMT